MLLIQTHANQERVAEVALSAPHRQCSVYFPKIMTRCCHARRVEHVERPFIQRYGFVNGDWRTVRTTPGVSHVVASGEEVERAAAEILAREIDGYVLIDPLSPFTPGDAVYVTSLAARGLFVKMRDGLRAEILLGMIRTVLPISSLEQVV